MNLWQGNKIDLRLISVDDYVSIYESEIETNSDIQDFYGEVNPPLNIEQVRQNIEKIIQTNTLDDKYFFVVTNKEKKVVGIINTHHVNTRHKSFQYGVFIFKEHQKMGYAKEAIKIILTYMFLHLGYHKCNAHIVEYNQDSILLHQKMGFILEGKISGMHYSGGIYHSELIYGINKETFQSLLTS